MKMTLIVTMTTITIKIRRKRALSKMEPLTGRPNGKLGHVRVVMRGNKHRGLRMEMDSVMRVTE